MNASHLSEDVFTDDGLVGCYGNTAETLNHAGYIVQLVFHNVRLSVELVLQNSLYRS